MVGPDEGTHALIHHATHDGAINDVLAVFDVGQNGVGILDFKDAAAVMAGEAFDAVAFGRGNNGDIAGLVQAAQGIGQILHAQNSCGEANAKAGSSSLQEFTAAHLTACMWVEHNNDSRL
jgi:hypothetical protein